MRCMFLNKSNKIRIMVLTVAYPAGQLNVIFQVLLRDTGKTTIKKGGCL